MSLVYCCKQDTFFNAVQHWVEQSPSSNTALPFLPVVLKEFLTQTLYSPLFCVRTSRVFAFESVQFSKPFNQWVQEEIERAPDHATTINATARLIIRLINNEAWAINQGLVVYDCLDDKQKKLKVK